MSASEIETRHAQTSDLGDVVETHLSAFPDSFMSLLGSRFLFGYYQTLLATPGALFVVGVAEQDLVGFAAGCDDSTILHRRIRKNPSLVLGAARQLAFSGRLRSRIVDRARQNVRSATVNASVDYPGFHEISSVAVSSKQQGRGVGGRVLSSYLSQLSPTLPGVFITTDADDDDVIRFYERFEFCVDAKFVQPPDRQMISMVRAVAE